MHPKETAMSTAPAFQTRDKLKPLAFDPAKLNGLSERMIRSHGRTTTAVRWTLAVVKSACRGARNKDLPPSSTTT